MVDISTRCARLGFHARDNSSRLQADWPKLGASGSSTVLLGSDDLDPVAGCVGSDERMSGASQDLRADEATFGVPGVHSRRGTWALQLHQVEMERACALAEAESERALRHHEVQRTLATSMRVRVRMQHRIERQVLLTAWYHCTVRLRIQRVQCEMSHARRRSGRAGDPQESSGFSRQQKDSRAPSPSPSDLDVHAAATPVARAVWAAAPARVSRPDEAKLEEYADRAALRRTSALREALAESEAETLRFEACAEEWRSEVLSHAARASSSSEEAQEQLFKELEEQRLSLGEELEAARSQGADLVAVLRDELNAREEMRGRFRAELGQQKERFQEVVEAASTHAATSKVELIEAQQAHACQRQLVRRLEKQVEEETAAGQLAERRVADVLRQELAAVGDDLRATRRNAELKEAEARRLEKGALTRLLAAAEELHAQEEAHAQELAGLARESHGVEEDLEASRCAEAMRPDQTDHLRRLEAEQQQQQLESISTISELRAGESGALRALAALTEEFHANTLAHSQKLGEFEGREQSLKDEADVAKRCSATNVEEVVSEEQGVMEELWLEKLEVRRLNVMIAEHSSREDLHEMSVSKLTHGAKVQLPATDLTCSVSEMVHGAQGHGMESVSLQAADNAVVEYRNQVLEEELLAARKRTTSVEEQACQSEAATLQRLMVLTEEFGTRESVQCQLMTDAEQQRRMLKEEVEVARAETEAGQQQLVVIEGALINGREQITGLLAQVERASVAAEVAHERVAEIERRDQNLEEELLVARKRTTFIEEQARSSESATIQRLEALTEDFRHRESVQRQLLTEAEQQKIMLKEKVDNSTAEEGTGKHKLSKVNEALSESREQITGLFAQVEREKSTAEIAQKRLAEIEWRDQVLEEELLAARKRTTSVEEQACQSEAATLQRLEALTNELRVHESAQCQLLTDTEQQKQILKEEVEVARAGEEERQEEMVVLDSVISENGEQITELLSQVERERSIAELAQNRLAENKRRDQDLKEELLVARKRTVSIEEQARQSETATLQRLEVLTEELRAHASVQSQLLTDSEQQKRMLKEEVEVARRFEGKGQEKLLASGAKCDELFQQLQGLRVQVDQEKVSAENSREHIAEIEHRNRCLNEDVREAKSKVHQHEHASSQRLADVTEDFRAKAMLQNHRHQELEQEKQRFEDGFNVVRECLASHEEPHVSTKCLPWRDGSLKGSDIGLVESNMERRMCQQEDEEPAAWWQAIEAELLEARDRVSSADALCRDYVGDLQRRADCFELELAEVKMQSQGEQARGGGALTGRAEGQQALAPPRELLHLAARRLVVLRAELAAQEGAPEDAVTTRTTTSEASPSPGRLKLSSPFDPKQLPLVAEIVLHAGRHIEELQEELHHHRRKHL